MKGLTTWWRRFAADQLVLAQLGRSIDRMERVGLLARLAMSITSDAHVYSVWKLNKTLKQAEQFTQNAEGDLPEEVQDLYQKLTDRYLTLMDAIPQQFAAKLLAELERAPMVESDENMVSKLYTRLGL
jgi:hypothetical protein